jgi:hypothetical protein
MGSWQCDGCSTRNDEIWGACTKCHELHPVDSRWATGPTLIQLYVGDTQVDAASRYRVHVAALASLGYRPVSTSWGEERPDAGSAFFFGNLEEAYRIGTLLVTYASTDTMGVA